MDIVRSELGFVFGAASAVLFMLFGESWLAALGADFSTLLFFLWLFSVMLWMAFGVVRHADCLAIKLGEPYGTLILTLSVISIEVIMISAVMLTGNASPTLGRDMMFAVVMIVLNGLVGVSLLMGAWKHREQTFNFRGASTFLSVLIPLSVLTMILPDFTKSSEIGTFSVAQVVYITLITLGLYGAFLAIQTSRHSDYFIQPKVEAVDADGAEHVVDDAHGELVIRSIPFHGVMLILYMLPIVLLSKKLALIVDYGISSAGAPAALGGMLVAILVLSPEGMATVRAAMHDQLQRSMNVCLGSALATICLTAPAVLLIGVVTGNTIVLGLDGVSAVLLLLTLFVSVVNLSMGRTNVIHGVVHLVLFATYIMMIFD